MWGNISKLTQFDILIGLHKQSHHSDYNAIVRKQQNNNIRKNYFY